MSGREVLECAQCYEHFSARARKYTICHECSLELCRDHLRGARIDAQRRSVGTQTENTRSLVAEQLRAIYEAIARIYLIRKRGW